MSGYNELIDNFEVMREYVRQYYAFGIYSRSEYARRNDVAKSQDNVIRRLNSWLRPYLAYYCNEEKERVYYFSVDGRSIVHNPLFRAYQSKSMGVLRTQLFFYSLAVLSETEFLRVSQIKTRIERLYDQSTNGLSVKQATALSARFSFDTDSLRDALEDGTAVGVFEMKMRGRVKTFRLRNTTLPLEPLRDGIFFASEQTPLGVIGSFLLHRMQPAPPPFVRFKHRYFLNTLDDNILYLLCQAMQAKTAVDVMTDLQPDCPLSVWPLKLYCGTQNGRQHLLCFDAQWHTFRFIRLDRIRSVQQQDAAAACPVSDQELAAFESAVWGPGYSPQRNREKAHVELVLHVEPEETFIVRRLAREKRCGETEQISETQWKLTADIYAPLDMLPWVRSFIGRIERFSCTDKGIRQRFIKGLAVLRDIYFSNAEPELSGPRPRRPVPLKNAGKQATPLFHEIYGNYYAVIAAILHRIGADTVKVSALDGLLQNAFEDGRVNLVNKMLKDWKLLIRDPETKGVFAPITKLPEIPLTTLEVRWLKTALADPRASLFLPEEGVPETGDLQPLYSPEQIVCYDRYTDGDPFTDPEYRQRFRLILKAVREHRQLGVAFLSTNSGQERYDVVCPYGLEYSEKDDKFRMIARKPDQSPMQINLSSIRYCEDKGPFAPVGDGAVPPQRERTLELLLFDNNNALERVMLHFSDLKKRTRKLDDRRYRVELTYQAAEEKEMIMRLLSFGPAVKVLSPDSVVEEIRQRLQRQLALTEVGQQG